MTGSIGKSMDSGGGLSSEAAQHQIAHADINTINRIDPLWKKFYHEAELSAPRSGLGILSTLRQGAAKKRFQRSSEIIQEPDDEIDTTDKVVVVVSKTLSDKNSVPGHVYRELIEKFKERCEGRPLQDVGENGDSPSSQIKFTKQRRSDAKSIIALVTASFLDSRPSFGNTKSLHSLTVSAVEILVLMQIYELIMEEIRLENAQKDADLTSKLNELAPAIQSFEKLANHLSTKAIHSLKKLPTLRSSLEKVQCCSTLVDQISEQFAASVGGDVMSADHLLNLVSQHLMVAQVPFLNTEMVFLDSFVEDDRYTSGMEGYALVTVQAAVHYLNESSRLQHDLTINWNHSHDDVEGENDAGSSDIVNEKGWLVYRGQEVQSKSAIGVEIQKSVKVIPKMAFFRWKRLAAMEIPQSLTEIHQRVFHSCSALKEVHLPDSIVNIGDSAFCGCVSLTSIRLPRTLDSIGDYFFYGCVSLQSIDIPPTVRVIGRNAFHGCSALTNISIPNVVEIGDRAFRNCSSLSTIDIPPAITVIKESTFSGCSKLFTVCLPRYVTVIRRKAFFGCSRLSTIFFPEDLESIEAFAFQKAEFLTTIHLPKTTLVDKTAFEDCKTLEEIRDDRSTLVDWLKRRYNDLPAHKCCYSTTVTTDALVECHDSFDDLDSGSVNPMQILLANPQVSTKFIDVLVQKSLQIGKLLLHQDRQGRNALHYLCHNVKASFDVFYTTLDSAPGECVNLLDGDGKTCTATAFDSFLSLSIRRLLYRYRPVNANELTFRADVAKELTREVELSYVNTLSTKCRCDDLTFSTREANGWVSYVSQVRDPALMDAILMIVEKSSRETVKKLATAKNFSGQTAMKVALPMIQTAFRKALIFFERYHLLEELIYQSRSCIVYFAEDTRSCRQVALKFYKKKSHFLGEAKVRLESPSDVSTARFVHDNIMQIVAIHDGDKDEEFQIASSQLALPPFCMVMEQGLVTLSASLRNGTLSDDNYMIMNVLFDIACSLQFIHQEGFVHGDIRSENIVRRSDGKWALIDFDSAAAIGSAVGLKTRSSFLPPEMVVISKGRPLIGTKKSSTSEGDPIVKARSSFDAWSFGLLMYQLLTHRIHILDGVDLFGDLEDANLRVLARWTNDETIFRIRKVRDPARELLRHLLDSNPQHRLSMSDVINHPFFKPKRDLLDMEKMLKQAVFRNNTFLTQRIRESIYAQERLIRDTENSSGEDGNRPEEVIAFDSTIARIRWNEETIVISGNLEMVSQGFMKKRKTRFFVLRTYGVVEYYTSEDELRNHRTAGTPIHGVVRSERASNANDLMQIDCEGKLPNVVLRVSPTKDLEKWILLINKVFGRS